MSTAVGTRSREIRLQKMESLTVDQGLFGKMRGYGTITRAGTGGTPECFEGIESLQAFGKNVEMLRTLPQPKACCSAG
jgi:hypothetical protein